MTRYWIGALLAAAALWAGACNDDPDPGVQTDTGAADVGDAGTDVIDVTADTEVGVDTPDVDPDTPDMGDSGDTGDVVTCGDLTPCGPGDTCEGDDFTCHNGCCVPTTECAAQDQPCTDASFNTDGYVCDLPAGICGRRCETDAPWDCPLGSWCVATDSPALPLDGLCRNSNCDDACFEPGACGDDPAFTCDTGDGAGSGTCVAFGGTANLCLGAGDIAEGGDCGGEADAIENGLPCDAGLRCFDGKCVAPCLYNASNPDAGCAGDPECLPVFESAGDNQPGVCGESCDAFSSGQCTAGTGCTFALTEGTMEVATWYCRDLEGDSLPTIEIDEECSTADPPTNLCEEGHYCHVDGGTGTCTQYCDTSGDLRDCPALPGEPALGDGVGSSAFGSVTTYKNVDADTEDLDVWELPGGDETLFAGLDSFSLDAGSAYSVVAFDDDGTDSAALLRDWATTPALESDAPYFSLYNLSDTSISLYALIDDFFDTTLAAGVTSDEIVVGNGEFTSLGFGFFLEAEYGVSDVWQEFSFLNQIAVSWGDFTDVLVVGLIEATGGEPEAQLLVLPDDSPDLGDDEAAIRLINASASTPSVDVDWGIASLPDETDVGFGNVTATWGVLSVPGGGGTVTDITLSWTAGGADNKTVSTSTIRDGDLVTVVLWDDPSVGVRQIHEIWGPSDPGADASFQLTNLTEHPLTVGRLEAALARGVAAPRYPTSGAAFAGAPGAQTLVVRDATAAGLALLEEPSVTFNDDMIRGIVFGPTGTTPAWDLFDFEHAAPSLPADDSGDAAVRFIHGANGASNLLLRLRRVLSCVETEIVGVGRCVE